MRPRTLFVESLVVLSGPPLHGKTTIATALAARSNLRLIDLDEVRMKHFPQFADQPGQLEATTRAYELMIADALGVLSTGQPVVLAGTFSRRAFQRPLCDALQQVRHRIFSLKVGSIEPILSRIGQRRREGTLSAIHSEDQYRWSLGLVEPWPDDVAVIDIDGTQQVDAIVETILDRCADLQEFAAG